jgi:uncharacterized secreted protein with C-terminal beta-propeller domain
MNWNGYKQHTELHRGLIYVMRRVNGVDVPLRIYNQLHYREWLGCFSAI